MKRVFVFIALKIVEMLGLCAFLLQAGLFSKWFCVKVGDAEYYPFVKHILFGSLLEIAALGVGCLLVLGLTLLIRANWQLANKLTEGEV